MFNVFMISRKGNVKVMHGNKISKSNDGSQSRASKSFTRCLLLAHLLDQHFQLQWR
jgi:hypothetical protein